MPRPIAPGVYARAVGVIAQACLLDLEEADSPDQVLVDTWRQLAKTLSALPGGRNPVAPHELRRIADVLEEEADSLGQQFALLEDDAEDLPADPEAGAHMPECDCDECVGLVVGLSDQDTEDLLDESDGAACLGCGRADDHHDLTCRFFWTGKGKLR